jgi:hypothetical protein
MNQTYFDIVVAKDYEIKNANGGSEKKTSWNKVGTAWPAKSGTAMIFELFALPSAKYVIKFQNNNTKEATNE